MDELEKELRRTLDFGFHEIVVNANKTVSLVGSHLNLDNPHVYRGITMQFNKLDCIYVATRNRGSSWKIAFIHGSVVIVRDGVVQHYLYIHKTPVLTEEEFFQKSMIEDYRFIDYDLYLQIVKFYDTVLEHIF